PPSCETLAEPVKEPLNSSVLTSLSDVTVFVRITFGSLTGEACGVDWQAPRTTATTAARATNTRASGRRVTGIPQVVPPSAAGSPSGGSHVKRPKARTAGAERTGRCLSPGPETTPRRRRDRRGRTRDRSGAGPACGRPTGSSCRGERKRRHGSG